MELLLPPASPPAHPRLRRHRCPEPRLTSLHLRRLLRRLQAHQRLREHAPKILHRLGNSDYVFIRRSLEFPDRLLRGILR